MWAYLLTQYLSIWISPLEPSIQTNCFQCDLSISNNTVSEYLNINHCSPYYRRIDSSESEHITSTQYLFIWISSLKPIIHTNCFQCIWAYHLMQYLSIWISLYNLYKFSGYSVCEHITLTQYLNIWISPLQPIIHSYWLKCMWACPLTQYMINWISPLQPIITFRIDFQCIWACHLITVSEYNWISSLCSQFIQIRLVI